jgi:hypothetical protein
MADWPYSSFHQRVFILPLSNAGAENCGRTAALKKGIELRVTGLFQSSA